MVYHIVYRGCTADFSTFILIKKVLLAVKGKTLILPESLRPYLIKTVFARNPPSIGKGGGERLKPPPPFILAHGKFGG